MAGSVKLLNIDPVNILAMRATADALIVNALTFGAPGIAPVVGEVKAAHATVLAGASEVASAWSPILSALGYQVNSKAVLIHSSPEVQFTDVVTGKAKQRELADTLFVIDLIKAGEIADRRAALTQAKLASKTGHISLGKSGKAQRNLYMHWPAFTMPRGYGQHPRDLHDTSCIGLAVDGCRFGGIDFYGSRRDWRQILPAQKMNARGKPSLGQSLLEMACGTAGRAAISGGKDPWSELVDELLKISFGITYPSSGCLNRHRETVSLVIAESHSIVLRTSSHFAAADLPPGRDSLGPEEAESPQGISFLHVELVEAEERSRIPTQPG